MSNSIRTKRAVQSGKTIAITSRNIKRNRFCTDGVGSLSDWQVIQKYRCKLSVVDTASEGFTVSAKALHKALESKRDFSNWIGYRIEQADLEKEQDYLSNKIVVQIRGKSGSTRSVEITDYLLTPNAAKELAMMENTAVGKLVRRYFILCEKIAKTYTLYNATRAEAFAEIDNSIKHELSKRRCIGNMEVIHREASQLITGATPSEWKAATGLSPRDAMQLEDRKVFLAAYKCLADLLCMGKKWAVAKADAAKLYKGCVSFSKYKHGLATINDF